MPLMFGDREKAFDCILHGTHKEEERRGMEAGAFKGGVRGGGGL